MIKDSRKDAARRKPRWFTPALLGLALGGMVGLAATLLLPAIMSEPAPSNLLRDRQTVGTTHVPDGLDLPPLCRYVDFHDNLSSWDWQIDCGEGTNVRATLAVNLDRAGWSTCKATATDSTLVKGNRELVVTDSRGRQLPISMTESVRKACP